MSARIGLSMLVLSLLPTGAWGAGFYIPDVGVRALGRAGAFVARSDDGTAAWYNPAGFADQRGTTFMVDTAFTKQSINFQRTDNLGRTAGFNPIGNNGSPKLIPFLGISSDFGLKNLTFSLNVYGPMSKDTNYDPLGAQRYSQLVSNSTEGFYQFSVGWRAAKWFKIGAGLRPGWFSTKQSFAVQTLVGPEGSSDVRVALDVKDNFTFSGSVGMIISPWSFLDIGVSYRFATTIGAEGTLTANEEDVQRLRNSGNPAVSNLGLQGDQITLGLTMPRILRVGARFKHERFDVEADFNWEHWAGFGRIEVIPQNITYTLNSDTPQPLSTIVQERGYDSGWSVRLGSDIRILPGRLTARLGYFYEAPAVPVESLAPSLVDTPKHGFTVGLSAKFGWFGISAAYAHVQHVETRVLDSTSRAINLTLLALEQPDLAPVVGNGIYRAGWDMLSVGISIDIDTLAGWTHRQPSQPVAKGK